MVPIEDLRREAERLSGQGRDACQAEGGGKVVAVVEYRDGTVVDVVREVRGL